jgi:hypothetical protein
MPRALPSHVRACKLPSNRPTVTGTHGSSSGRNSLSAMVLATGISTSVLLVPANAFGQHAAQVYIDAPAGVRLQQDTTGDHDWTTVCSARCDRQLPTDYAYRIVGGGLVASRPFTLDAPDGGFEVLEVHGASKVVSTGGLVMLGIGVTVGVGGLFVGGLAYSWSCGIIGSSSCERKYPPWFGTVVVGGAALAAVGLVVALDNARTSVVQHVKAGETPSPSPDSLPRMPTWRQDSPEQMSLTGVLSIPIASGRF